MHVDLARNYQSVALLCRRYGVARLDVFGSSARGMDFDPRSSDFDFLVEFTPDRLNILPYQGKPEDETATVRSTVRRDNGSMVQVNYSLHKTPQGWKAYDVQIEGVSYVKSFRTDFGSEIQQKGLEAVIQRLEAQIASGTPPKPTASS